MIPHADIQGWICQQVAAEGTATESYSTFSNESENGIWMARESGAEFEVDAHYEIDSAYCDSTASIETAPAESWSEVTCEEDDRIYHKWYGYAPVDDRGMDLLDFCHEVWRQALKGRLTTIPLRNPQRILDMGTGTGIWSIDMGYLYPSAFVIGTDVSQIQPSWVPPNVKFIMDNFNASVYREVKTYDMIHMRDLLGCVEDWPSLIAKCFRSLEPGGWLEVAEPSIHILPFDPSGPVPIPAFSDWANTFVKAGEETGMSFDVASNIAGWLTEAGFVNVKLEKITVPVGGKTQLGRYNQARLHWGVFDFSARILSKVLKWHPDNITVFLAYLRHELELCNRRGRATHYQIFYAVHAQKPLVFN